jgi:hypothetical protein
MQVGIQMSALKRIASRRVEDAEKKRMSNDVIMQGWVIAGCDTILSRIAADTLVPFGRVGLVTKKIQSLADIPWQAGRDKVIGEIMLLLVPTSISVQ